MRPEFHHIFEFFGHSYLKHAGLGWNEHQELWYHIYSTASDHKLKDAVTLAYNSSLHPKVLGNKQKPSSKKSMSSKESEDESSDESRIKEWMLKASNTPGA